MANELTHIDEKGDVRMVDVSAKPDTERIAVAEGFISMHQETLDLIVEGKAAKGDVLACARVAGVMAAKQTSSLIPMCHPLNIMKAKVECTPVHAGERADLFGCEDADGGPANPEKCLRTLLYARIGGGA